MKPNTMTPGREIINVGWSWRTDENGNVSDSAITAAALLECARLLRLMDCRLEGFMNEVRLARPVRIEVVRWAERTRRRRLAAARRRKAGSGKRR